MIGQLCASSSSYPDGYIDDLAAQVGNVLANVFGTELVCRTVFVSHKDHVMIMRAWRRKLLKGVLRKECPAKVSDVKPWFVAESCTRSDIPELGAEAV